MIDEKKLIEDILQHENVLASANYVYKNLVFDVNISQNVSIPR